MGSMSLTVSNFWLQEHGASPPPVDTYVTEDGSQNYVTEDGTQNYAPET